MFTYVCWHQVYTTVAYCEFSTENYCKLLDKDAPNGMTIEFNLGIYIAQTLCMCTDYRSSLPRTGDTCSKCTCMSYFWAGVLPCYAFLAHPFTCNVAMTASGIRTRFPFKLVKVLELGFPDCNPFYFPHVSSNIVLDDDDWIQTTHVDHLKFENVKIIFLCF